jgi:hypothetical protein
MPYWKQSVKYQKMYAVIMDYIRSGLKQTDYFRLHSEISKHQFKYWFCKYRKELPSNNGNSFAPIKFDDTPVEVKPPEEMKICYPNGVVIYLLASTPDNVVKSLISII